MTWKDNLMRAAIVGVLTVLIGGLLAQTVTFPSRYVSPGRDEQVMLMDTVGMLGLVAAAADFLVSLLVRPRIPPK